MRRSNAKKKKTSTFERKPATYKVFHATPFQGQHMDELRFILVPCGTYYGDIPRNAGVGDKIRFLGGDEAEILDVCEIHPTDKLANILSMTRYSFPMKDVFAAWIIRAKELGMRPEVISTSRCMLVYHGERTHIGKNKGNDI